MSDTDTTEPDYDAENKRLGEMLNSHCIQLMEHFTSVRIVAVKHDAVDNLSRLISRGNGDFYSQYGSVKEWLIEKDAQAKAEATKEE